MASSFDEGWRRERRDGYWSEYDQGTPWRCFGHAGKVDDPSFLSRHGRRVRLLLAAAQSAPSRLLLARRSRPPPNAEAHNCVVCPQSRGRRWTFVPEMRSVKCVTVGDGWVSTGMVIIFQCDWMHGTRQCVFLMILQFRVRFVNILGSDLNTPKRFIN